MSKKTRVPQKIGFKEKLEKDDDITIFIYRWQAAKIYFEVFIRFIRRNEII